MDILGAKGSRFAPNRCNLLLEVDDRSLTEEDLVLNIRRFRPEGFGVECFMADVLEIPMEAPIPGSDLLIWDINATLPPTGQRLWVLGVKEINMVRGEWDMAYLFDTKSTWLIAPTPEQTSGPLRCLDFFCWSIWGVEEFPGSFGKIQHPFTNSWYWNWWKGFESLCHDSLR